MLKLRGFILIAAIVLLVVVLGLGAGAASVFWMVGRDPDGTFTKEGILKILSVESAVYYNDDQTKVGTFFEGAHRDYVPYDSIPKPIVEALVAAEDHDFWTHKGVDLKAIAYAMADNIKAGKMRRGGSTLTQQTAKNLFNRKGRTFSGKFKELINAFKLEKHFEKEQILEFYLNQFFVSGNGHGVRIAARYFFDKELSQLSLVECAFIAGSVKGPNQYNPFIQPTAEKKERALKRAKTRVGYVLGQMLRTEKISEAQYKAAMAQPLIFKRGVFRFSLSTNMVLAKHVLESEAVQAALDRHDVQDWMAEGLRITTTLDARLQLATEAAVYRNLSRVDLTIRGYHAPDSSQIDVLSHFEPAHLQVGQVVDVVSDKAGPQSIELAFGTLRGKVGSPALQAFFSAWNMYETGSREQPSAKVKANVMARYFAKGAKVLCLTPAPGPKDSLPLEQSLEIVQVPKLQGGGQIVKEGKVLANVGGFGNTGYDRVNQARRQFGSTFKPIVYAAALQLGWKPLDPIPNMRQVFRIGTTFYFPKPDHHPEDTVSMVWAGRRSENIASIYLLYHLMDKCDFARFWSEAKSVGMAPENFSMQEEFAVFVRDSLGLVLDRDHIAELRYQKATQELALDLTFDGRIEEGEALKSLPYGLGYRSERNKYAGSRDVEDALRFRILKRCYLEYFDLARSWDRRMTEGLHVVLGRKKAAMGAGAIGVFDALPDTTWEGISDPNLNSPDDSVFIGGEISVATLQKLSEKLLEKDSDAEGSPYTKENLYNSTDFRAMVALRNIVAISRKLGIRSKLDAVLAYPLGVNVITLGEAVSVYESFADGYTYRTQNGSNQLLVERITLRDGTVIYEDYLDREKAIADQARYGLEAILGSVITGGTGQQIGRKLRVQAGENGEVNLRIPAYGKTGTTNDYRNAAFLGYVAAPRGPGKGFDPTVATTIGVYGGFDDNHPMTRRGFRGTGASVAIPAWLDMAKAVCEVGDFGKNADVLDLEVQATGEPSMFQDEKYGKYIVSKRTGLPISGSQTPDGLGGYAEDFSDEILESESDTTGQNENTAVETVRVRED
jgi:penicillin-binding protein 1A